MRIKATQHYLRRCRFNPGFEVGPQSENETTSDFGIQEGAFQVNVQVIDDDSGAPTGSAVVEIPTFFLLREPSHRRDSLRRLAGNCERDETPVTLSESDPVTVFTSQMTGVVRASISGDCTRYEAATALPEEGPLAICVSRVSGQTHSAVNSAGCPRASYPRLIGTPAP